MSDLMLNFSKSVPIKKQTNLHLGWPECKCLANFHCWCETILLTFYTTKMLFLTIMLRSLLRCKYCQNFSLIIDVICHMRKGGRGEREDGETFGKGEVCKLLI